MFSLLLYFGNTLNGRASSPYDPDRLSREISLGIPSCGMQEFALEIVQPFNLRPLPIIQETGSIDQYMSPILRSLAIDINVDFPDPFLFIPSRTDNLRLKCNVLVKIILVCKVLEILHAKHQLCPSPPSYKHTFRISGAAA